MLKKILDYTGLQYLWGKINSKLDQRIAKALIAHILDSNNPDMVLGADQGPVITGLISALENRVNVLNTNLAGLNARFHFDKVALVQPFFDDAEKSFGFRLYYDVSMTAGYAIHFYFNGEKRITLRFLDIDGVWKVSWTGLLQ
ncbi:hypothetical protein L0N08_10730 [Enterocloster aldenensis]|uniref:SnoaL-like domain-containing protein n=1 Tax=Enterocloster aldenensis TaxID=358742 RepID=A0AAW5BX70_9FIRM|nr:hypothetical protein [Enterocloster aldenensis]